MIKLEVSILLEVDTLQAQIFYCFFFLQFVFHRLDPKTLNCQGRIKQWANWVVRTDPTLLPIFSAINY